MLLAADVKIVASFITTLEIGSALWRRDHNDELSADEHAAADDAFEKLNESWSEIGDMLGAREIALELITRHVLRSADAIQLASALIACAYDPASLPFVTLDVNLASAARAEGFTVLP
jgi:predicted nucleic acid-binding protein